MKVLAVMMCCLLVAQANVLKSEHHVEFEKWVAKHGKTYNSEVEREFRFKIFVEALKWIIKHNREYDAGLQSFKMGLNKYSDMLESEVFTGLNVPDTPKKNLYLPQGLAAPDSFDWRSKGAVTPVKDQGQCGSCWSFSATGSLEGALFVKTGQLVSLSEKNLMDCSWSYGNMGCSGGWMDSAFDYVVANGGLDTEASYPYQPVNGFTCKYNPSNSALVEKSYVDIPSGDESALKEAVANHGPVSVAINANSDFQRYSGGVMTSSNCSPSGLNHGVLVVGYGTEGGQDYWLVKNSWGTSFGESGYIKMRRNYNNMCGIAEAASYPTL